MSFDELYDSCFRNATLVKVPNQKQSKDPDPCLLVTLDHVFSHSHYVVFFLGGVQTTNLGPKGVDLGHKLEGLVQKKNGTHGNKEKAQSSPARIRKFFGIKKKKKTKETPGEQVEVSVVVVDTETRNNQENQPNIALPGWYIFAPQSASTKSRLLRSLGFEVAPSLSVVDCLSHSIVTTEGRRLLQDDPNGDNFPWWPPSHEEVLRGPISRLEGEKKETIEWKDLKGKVKALFFGASWCPPCRVWIKQLFPVYESLKKANIPFEIIFCSSDRTKEFYEQFTASMPWYSFPYNPSHTLLLTRLFNVSGIPSLILIDEDNRILTKHGRQALVGDPKGNLFPWGPQPLYELNELTVCRLRDEPSLVLFTEGSPEDVQFSESVLHKLARRLFEERISWENKRVQETREGDENGNGTQPTGSQEECSSVDSDIPLPPQADPLQIFYTGEDPICDHILEQIFGLGDAELPLICIVDAMGGRLSISSDPDVSEEILDKFVSDYRNNKLQWTNLPGSEHQTVGGIPMHEIQNALMENSPSQNSIKESL